MVTLVGRQCDFSEAMKALLELDFDAIEAYTDAIDRIKSESYKIKLAEFKQDHERHIQELSYLLQNHQVEVPQGPDMKQWLTKGKVILANLIDDKAILAAMRSNEMDTNNAYTTILEHSGMWQDASSVLIRGLADEIKHKQFLESILEAEK